MLTFKLSFSRIRHSGRAWMWRFLRGEQGNVSIVMALSITAIIFFAALAIDLGFLIMEKESLQDKTEAAALSGAYSLANHPPPDGYGLMYQAIQGNYQANKENFGMAQLRSYVYPGFYDIGDQYPDFPHYQNFASVRYGEMPADAPINAVAVLEIPKNVDTIEIKPAGETGGRVKVSAIAYFEPYGLVSLGHDPDTAGIEFINWRSMNIEIENMGIVHSNTNISYDAGTHDPIADPLLIKGLTKLSATGTITNCPTASFAPCLIAPPIEDELDKLKMIADAEGRLCTLGIADFPLAGRMDGDGNEYKKLGSFGYIFRPHDGDHGGATYYIQGSPTSRLILKGFPTYPAPITHARNFTLCTDCNQVYTTAFGGSALRLGGEGNDTVYIYCRGNIGGPLGNNAGGALGSHIFDGVIFRVGGYFGIRPSDGQTHYMHKLRVIADGKIQIMGRYVPAETFTYNGSFNSPTLYFRTRLGTLKESCSGPGTSSQSK